MLQELAGGDDSNRNGDMNGDGFVDGPRSPDAMNGGVDQGYTTPFVNGGATSAWGGGATPYGATPYGQGDWGN